MKCSVPSCGKTAYYVILDAYLDGNCTIYRREFNVYALCQDHDGMWHTSKLRRLLPRHSGTLAKKLRIVI